MQKILVLTSTFPRWQHDVEPPFVFELCKHLADEFDVYVVAPHAKNALEQEIMHNIHVVRFRYFFERFETLCYEGGILARLKAQPLRLALIPFFIVFQLIAAYRLVKTENIALIHAHWIIPQGLVACLLRYMSRQPIAILCTSHGGDLFSLKGKIFQFLKRKILLNVQAISVVNSVMANEVNALCAPYKPMVSVIPMGVDFQHTFVPSTAPKKPFSLIFVGRLVEKKGVSYLIKALPAILEKFPETQLSIIGTGPEHEALQRLVEELNLQENIVFLGAVLNSELPFHYQQHQLAVFPFIVADNGDREGLPVVISEAIGCGCCIITTDLPGIEDIIIHGHNGLVIEQKNNASIASAIIELFSNPNKISHYVSTSRQEISVKQDSKYIAYKYTQLLESLLD